MSYYSGTSGRMAQVAVTPVLTADEVDFSTALASLDAGTIPYSTNAVAEITKWSLDNPPDGELPESKTLESGADTEGMLAADLLRGGFARNSFSIEGQVNSTSIEKYRTGRFAVAAFLLKKNVPAGYKGVKGRYEGFRVTGSSVDGAVTMFAVTFRVSGVLPAWS